jgi:hypothetical protein
MVAAGALAQVNSANKVFIAIMAKRFSIDNPPAKIFAPNGWPFSAGTVSIVGIQRPGLNLKLLSQWQKSRSQHNRCPSPELWNSANQHIRQPPTPYQFPIDYLSHFPRLPP